MGDYKLVTPEGKEIIITDSEAFQLSSAIDGYRDSEEQHYNDPDEEREMQGICDIVDSVFTKFRDANIGGYFRPHEPGKPENDQTENCEVFRGVAVGPRRSDY